MRLVEWKPIETAPKNGQAILVCVAGPQNYYPDKVWWDTAREQWTIWVTNNNVRVVLGMEPTHWMELPAAPEGQADHFPVIEKPSGE